VSDRDERFDEMTIREGLQTAWAGRPLHFFPVIGSTNGEAHRMALAGAPHGALLIADRQTAGRGRMARRWLAPAGSSLLLSLILRPSLPPVRVQLATMACGLAAADTLEVVADVSAGLKWPNDVLIGDRKVAGILTEMSTIGDEIEFLVVGIGINVNLDPAALAPADDTPEEREALAQDPSLRAVAKHATSLYAETGRRVSRLKVLWRFLERFEFWYAQISDGNALHRAWSQRMCLRGRRVQVDAPGETLVGQVVGVDTDGALLLTLESGAQRRILAGDISLC
jgi:BirA family transcriptional regulator, biotin operon repressor / biotin---[acetyl-CoA-carboxylase] ligase